MNYDQLKQDRVYSACACARHGEAVWFAPHLSSTCVQSNSCENLNKNNNLIIKEKFSIAGHKHKI